MFQEGRSRQLALRATAARLRAESQGLSSVRFDAEVAREQELVQSERATFAARVNAVQQAVGGLQRTRVHLQREMQITEPMVAKGLAPEVEAIKLQRQLSEVDLQIAERVNRFRADASTELVKVEAELAQVTEQLMARKDQMERTLIRAPMRGTVKNIRINTNGGVIQPGQDILELVPLDDRLLVEVKIRPSEVAFLRQGLPALVKLSAYDSQIYGSLKGTVQFISPDTLKEDRRPEEENYYRVVVATEQAHLEHQGKHLPVIPGMTAVVDIITGHRTVANYMLKPVLRLKEAFRET